MESEWLHSKERLAVERRAQQQKPALEGSAGAAWARLRQRLSRAEREARTARRLVVGLSGVAAVAVAGAFTVVMPRSDSIGSRGNVAEASVRAGNTQAPLVASAGQGEGIGPSGIALSVPVLPPEQPTGSLTPDFEIFRASGPQEGQPEPPNTQTPRQSTPAASSERPNTQPPAEGSPQSEPNASPRGGPATAGAAGQARKDSGSGGYPLTGTAAAKVKQPGSTPRPVRQPVSRPRPAARKSASGARRTARSSVRRRSRVSSRSRRRSRSGRRPMYWRVHRITRAGKTTYRLVDARGNWWEARRIRRGGQRK